MTESNGRSEALTAAVQRRIGLKKAVSKVETAAASASASPGWRDELVDKLEELGIALDQHVEEVEGDDGLLAELTTVAPRLVNKINRVRNEHPGLCSDLADTINRVASSEDADEVRRDVLEVLASIARHRQAGADLVYAGYSVDIGGAESHSAQLPVDERTEHRPTACQSERGPIEVVERFATGFDALTLSRKRPEDGRPI